MSDLATFTTDSINVKPVANGEQASESTSPLPQSNSQAITPIEADPIRPSSSVSDEAQQVLPIENNRSRIAETEHIVEWSPNSRYGKVPFDA